MTVSGLTMRGAVRPGFRCGTVTEAKAEKNVSLVNIEKTAKGLRKGLFDLFDRPSIRMA